MCDSAIALVVVRDTAGWHACLTAKCTTTGAVPRAYTPRSWSPGGCPQGVAATDGTAVPARRVRGLWDSGTAGLPRSEEHTSELQSRVELVCRLLLEKKK